MNNLVNKKGFSLFELIIVMAIIGLTATLAIWGFVSFQRSVTFGQAVNEVLSILKETKNLAKSNTLPKDLVFNTNAVDSNVYAYMLSFQDNKMTRSICSRSIGSTDNDWTCKGTSSEQLKSEEIYADINYVLPSSSACGYVLFENLTGDMHVRNIKTTGTNYKFNESNCSLTIKHNQTGAERTITINPVQNAIIAD